MQQMCEICSRQKFCGNVTTAGYCTGFMPQVETKWVATTDKKEAEEVIRDWLKVKEAEE